MLNYQDIITIIDDMRRYVYPPPRKRGSKKHAEFCYQSHCHWALTELRSYLYLHKREKRAELLIEDFRYKMDCFACESDSPETNFMFSAAYDAVTEVIDEILIVEQAYEGRG